MTNRQTSRERLPNAVVYIETANKTIGELRDTIARIWRILGVQVDDGRPIEDHVMDYVREARRLKDELKLGQKR